MIIEDHALVSDLLEGFTAGIAKETTETNSLLPNVPLGKVGWVEGEAYKNLAPR